MAVLYISVAVTCLSFFGRQTDAVLTLNLPKGSTFVMVVKLLLCLQVLMSVPIQLLPAFKILESRWCDPSSSSTSSGYVRKEDEDDNTNNNNNNRRAALTTNSGTTGTGGCCQMLGSKTFWKVNLLRSVVVLIAIGVSISVPFFGLFLNLVGAFSNSAASFILPPFFHLKIFGEASSRFTRVKNVSIVVFGVLASAASCIATIQAIIQAFQHEHEQPS